MSTYRVALRGERYGDLTVIKEAERAPDGTRRVWCSCACGTPWTLASVSSLRRGHLTSCGCRFVAAAKLNIKKAQAARTGRPRRRRQVQA